MKSISTGNCLTLTAVALASLGLAAGCCTKRSSQTAYYSETPKGYSGTVQESATQTTQSTEGQPNMVMPLYKETLAVGKREVDGGSVRVKKIVKTETVNQPIELRHEEVVIERQPASGQSAQSDNMGSAFQEKETVIRLKREEPVIEKRTESAGQIVLRQSSATEQRNIQEQVRSEDVDVIKSGNPQNVTIGAGVQSSSRENESMGGAESPSGQSSGGMITDPGMLSSSADSKSLAGRQCQFSNVKVKNVVGDRLVVLSPDNGQAVYVVGSQAASNIKPGDTVNITGTVRAGGSASGLSGDAAQTLSTQPMYIEAQKIEAAGQ